MRRLWLEQVERDAFDGKSGQAGLCSSGVLLADIPANESLAAESLY